ncbi:hypothetical protein COCMIDRAFT_102710 [Bipolaris oryzae ATCC 44560]|uniref:Uncharacterized protein n=1 Tax=Bipolaris oryzae ATCC 44560 TaxID=930090 RepID=W6YYV3_COCMI|nr:uncharacterized protein COCMIDRAFT_102710 [Bipolaris oryzae ATCC 44560]EUC42758.1 hypothetical protein COCMIDRAFT_102710 [Bipolaris oryzae ATCC 44560]
MSKRNNEGDVIANRISLLEAKGQKLLASLYGSRPDWDTRDNAATPQDEDDQDLKQNYAYDRIGLGGILPKDVENGSFTKRTLTSDDKLLQQLIGKKKAKAHIMAKQEAARPSAATKTHQYSKPAVAKKEVSDDEEDGRAATFKSKRGDRKAKKPPILPDSDDEDEEMRAKRLAAGMKAENQETKEPTTEAPVEDKSSEKVKEEEEAEPAQPAPKKVKIKPKSFLDEILAERSKKKSKKSKA